MMNETRADEIERKTRAVLQAMIVWASSECANPSARAVFAKTAIEGFDSAARRVRSSLAMAKQGQPFASPEWLAGEVGHFDYVTGGIVSAVLKKTKKAAQ